jgi:alkaline phosphatase
MAWFDPESSTCQVPGKEREDLLERARSMGYTVWRRGQDLSERAPNKLLGLFAQGHLAFQLDDAQLPAERRDPSLRRLTEIALESLGSDAKPFFLLVEGGRIDHAGHDHDAPSVAAETRAFDEAAAAVLAFQQQRPSTLVIVTADHATAGLAINEFVDWPSLGRQKASNERMIANVCSGVGGLAGLRDGTGFPDLEADIDAICAGTNIELKRRRLGHLVGERNGVTWVPRINEQPPATKGHTGEDIALYAGGPGAERFAGVLDNTDIPKRIAGLLGWSGLGVGPSPAQ